MSPITIQAAYFSFWKGTWLTVAQSMAGWMYLFALGETAHCFKGSAAICVFLESQEVDIYFVFHPFFNFFPF